MLIGPGTPVYAGMVVGICSRNEDMTVNVCKKKQLTNMRASGSDEALRLIPPRVMSLEQCLEFLVPSRGLFGYRSEFLTDTKGEGIMSSVLDSYAPMKGEIERRLTGSLISFETGEAVTYGLHAAQERGALFIGPGTPVYAGMVIGICSRNEDMTVNVCKKKQLTNMRASGSDEALRLTTPRNYSLEQCLEFLADDELLECTPKTLRIRKRELDHGLRMRQLMKKRNGQE